MLVLRRVRKPYEAKSDSSTNTDAGAAEVEEGFSTEMSFGKSKGKGTDGVAAASSAARKGGWSVVGGGLRGCDEMGRNSFG